jgi:hypothetical protein
VRNDIIYLSEPQMAARHRADLPDPRTTNPAVERAWRDQMIREAAYFRSQHRRPCADKELEDWLAAEQEIDGFLADRPA